jgi:Tfp pilus assembly protein PilN
MSSGGPNKKKAGMSDFNLLPGNYRKKRSKILAPLSAVVTVVFIVAALIFLESYLSCRAKAISFVEVGRMKLTMEEELVALSANIDRVREKFIPYMEVITKHRPWSSLLIGISSTVNERVWLTRLSTSSEEEECVLNGQATNAQAVFGLVDALERLDMVNSARLNSMNRNEKEETRRVNFEIKCRLNKILI